MQKVAKEREEIHGGRNHKRGEERDAGSKKGSGLTRRGAKLSDCTGWKRNQSVLETPDILQTIPLRSNCVALHSCARPRSTRRGVMKLTKKPSSQVAPRDKPSRPLALLPCASASPHLIAVTGAGPLFLLRAR